MLRYILLFVCFAKHFVGAFDLFGNEFPDLYIQYNIPLQIAWAAIDQATAFRVMNKAKSSLHVELMKNRGILDGIMDAVGAKGLSSNDRTVYSQFPYYDTYFKNIILGSIVKEWFENDCQDMINTFKDVGTITSIFTVMTAGFGFEVGGDIGFEAGTGIEWSLSLGLGITRTTSSSVWKCSWAKGSEWAHIKQIGVGTDVGFSAGMNIILDVEWVMGINPTGKPWGGLSMHVVTEVGVEGSVSATTVGAGITGGVNANGGITLGWAKGAYNEGWDSCSRSASLTEPGGCCMAERFFNPLCPDNANPKYGVWYLTKNLFNTVCSACAAWDYSLDGVKPLPIFGSIDYIEFSISAGISITAGLDAKFPPIGISTGAAVVLTNAYQNFFTCEMGRPTPGFQPPNFTGKCNEQGMAPCDVNTYSADGMKCKNCPEGKEAERGATKCIIKKGYYQKDLSKVEKKATQCEQGQYNDQNDQRGCKICDFGKSRFEEGKTSCEVCDLGTYQNQQEQSSCEVCDLGKYQNQQEQSSCKWCPLGEESEKVFEKCAACDAGKYFKHDTLQCSNCPVGFQSSTGQTVCEKCPMGKYQNQLGESACKPCGLGNYVNDLGSTNELDCKKCPSGKKGTNEIAKNIGDVDIIVGSTYYKNKGLVDGVLQLVKETSVFADVSLTNKDQPCLVDYDDDGDVDIFIGRANGDVEYWQNTGTRGSPKYVKNDAIWTYNEPPNLGSGENPAPEFVKKYDYLLVGTASQGVIKFSRLSDSGSSFNGRLDSKSRSWETYRVFLDNFGTDRNLVPRSVDVDNDGVLDYLIISAITTDKNTRVWKVKASDNPVEAFTFDNPGQVNLIDWDFDGDLDIVMSQMTPSGTANIKLYKNEIVFNEDCTDEKCDCVYGGHRKPPLGLAEGQTTTTPRSANCDFPLKERFIIDYFDATTWKPDHTLTTLTNTGSFMYAASVNDGGCVDCAEGASQPQKGHTSCIGCTAGTYADIKGLENCKNCNAGKFSNTDNSAQESYCRNCPTGQYSSDIALGKPDSSDYQDTWCTDFINGCEDGLCDPGDFSGSCTNTEMIWGYSSSISLTYEENFKFVDECISPDSISGGNCNRKAVCRFCPAGKFSDSTAQSTCTDCPAGWQQPFPGQSKCVECEQGRFNAATGKLTCIKCPVGEYQEGEGGTKCKSCEYGKFHNLVEQYNPNVCQDCPVGKSSWERSIDNPPYGVWDDMEDDPDQKCSNTHITRNACESPYTKKRNKCLMCPKGSYQDEQGKPTCKVCPSGYYSNGEAATQNLCEACSAGRYRKNKAVTGSDYIPTIHFPSEQCTESCPQGKYSTPDQWVSAEECITCPLGFFPDNIAPTHCHRCPDNTAMVPNYNSTLDFQNYDSEFTKTRRHDDCKTCANGKYVKLIEAYVNNGDWWAKRRQNVTSQSQVYVCELCPLGFFSTDEFRHACVGQCPYGKTMVPNYNKKIVDVDNFWRDSWWGGYSLYTRQRKMLVGYGDIPVSRLSSDCQDCPAGKYKKLINNVYVCELCPAGKFSTTVGANNETTCQFCPVGKRSVRPTVARCAESDKASCTLDECNDDYAIEECEQFSKFSTEHWNRKSIWLEQNTVGGATGCTACPDGSNSVQRAYTWQEVVGCPAIDDTVEKQDVYVDGCPEATAYATIYPECTGSCPVGQGFNPSTGCEACPVGKYNSNMDDTSPCDACPPGKYLDTTGNDALADCKQCTAGKYTHIDGAGTCDDCSKGRYQDSLGETTCKSCPEGKYLDTTGNGALADCTQCTAGKPNSELGSDEESDCEACVPGNYSPGNSKPCQLCEKGRFQNLSAQTECKTCPAGQFSEEVGQTECKNCGPGQYNPRAGRSTCKSCPVGKYSSETTNIVCAVCQNATVPLNQTGCESCEAGKQIIGRKCVETSSCQLLKYGYDNSNCACDNTL